MRARRLAPAKVNLFLHVGPLGDDGYHPICSLVSFADVGDMLTLESSESWGFAVEGPFAGALGAGDDNLVVRARRLVAEEFAPAWSPFRLTLDKRLPIASGVGGGSADAAAAMWLMAERAGIGSGADDKARLYRLGTRLGADVPMCLAGQPQVARGRGDELSPPPPFPDLDTVLVNPLRPSPTGAVYRGYDEAGAPGGAEAPAWPEAVRTAADVAAFLARCRNDLEAPAAALQPAIAEVLSALREQPETLFARMSGSGATCFALCANQADRDVLAAAISAAHPGWWVRACRLAGSA